MPSLATYWHTLRHLKPIQVYGRIRNGLPRSPGPERAPPPLALPAGPWVKPPPTRISMARPGEFRLLNETRDLGWPIDWRAADAPLLWQYNLHYFDDLNSRDANLREAMHAQVIDQWVEAHPRGARPAWDPYPISLRAVNWIKWCAEGHALSAGATASLASQIRWLTGRLEWHLLGNHLFANAKALLFAGCFFSGGEADRWLRAGVRILARELDEQVLPDGGNFELSPMYHAIFLADLLDLANLARHHPGRIPTGLVEAIADCATRMLDWLAVMIHPDGEIALFNDSAVGVAPNLMDLRGYAHRLRIQLPAKRATASEGECTLELLEDSGYCRLESADAVALCDVGRIGPDYLPGHAHADSLSFELSCRGRRLIVNGGTSRYGDDDIRRSERGTAAHSTVEVDGANSSEVWSGFRVAQRAKPFAVSCEAQPQRVSLCASHDGYRRLSQTVVHRRRWTMIPSAMRIEDTVTGAWRTATARYIVHASIRVEKVSASAWLLTTEDPEAGSIRFQVEGGRARLEPAWHSLEFGKRLATQAIAVDLIPGACASVTITWVDDEDPLFH